MEVPYKTKKKKEGRFEMAVSHGREELGRALGSAIKGQSQPVLGLFE